MQERRRGVCKWYQVAKMTNDIMRVRQLTSEIDGWLSDGEGELLYNLAKGVPSGQAILEVGSWKGKSAVRWSPKTGQVVKVGFCS